MEKRIAHVLGGNIEKFGEFFATLIVAELDVGTGALVIERVEFVVLHQRRPKTNILLPFVKKVLPVIETGNLLHVGKSSLVYVNVRPYARLLVLRAREMPATGVKSSGECDEFFMSWG